MQKFTNMLKPWIKYDNNVYVSLKSEACQRSMLRKKSLIDLYKCMGPTCAYTTNDRYEMQNHLQSHTPRIQVLCCAYCTTTVGSPRSLVNHVEEIHGECRFQCMFCFYRAFEVGNVSCHQHTYHDYAAKADSTIVVLPSGATQTKADYLIEICTSFQNNHALMRCSLCNSTHATVALFDAHASLHRGNSIDCPVCGLSLAKHEVRAHLNLHRSNFRKCLYCASSFDLKWQMYRHLSNDHYRKAMYCALKMESSTSTCDIFVLENLAFDVPDSRLMVATYVNGDILLQSKMDDKKMLVVKRVKDTSLPKIVKVQGGIKMAEDGTILKATETISSKTTSASSISTGDRSSIKNAISGPSEAGGITTVSIKNTVNAPGDRTVPSGSSSHAKRRRASNASCLGEDSKLEQMQVNGAVGTSVGKIIKLENVPSTVTNVNSGLVSTTTERTYPSQMAKTDSLSTTKLTIADESPKTETAVAETSTASAFANRTVAPVQRFIGPIKQPQNIVKVKDFGFIKTSIVESKMANTSNPCSSRNVVKLTRLDDGRLVIKLPSPSKPESQSVVGAPTERCAAPHMNAAKTELTEGKKLNAPAGVVRVLESRIVDTSASQQKLATNKQILIKPSHTVGITPMEPSVSNPDAAKSTLATKSKAPIGVIRVMKTETMNTSSFISPSKTIVGSSIERSVPNSNPIKPTIAGVNKTEAPNGFVRIEKSGIIVTSASPSKHVVGTSMEKSRPNSNAPRPSVIELTSAKVPAGFVRVVNGGILRTSVSPATSAAKEQILTSPNPPHTASVPNANTARSKETEANKTKTGVVRVVKTGTNNIAALPSKSVMVTSMERSVATSNAAQRNSTGARSSSAAVNKVQSTTIDKLNNNKHKQSVTGNCITTNRRLSTAPASTAVATVVTTSNQVVPRTAPPSSLHAVAKQRNVNTTHRQSSLFPVWDRYRVNFSPGELQIPFRFKGLKGFSFYRSLLELVSSKPLNCHEILICGAKDCQEHFGMKKNLAMHMARYHMIFPSSVIPCKLCDCLLYGRDGYIRHMLIHLNNKFVCLCRYHHCLLSDVVEHIKLMHKCDGFQLSLGHPSYRNPLIDVIVVIPSSFGPAEIAKSIASIVAEKDFSKPEAAVMAVPTVKAVSSLTFKADWSPVQAVIGDLYKCGFCQKVLQSELSFKNHLLLCERRDVQSYQCGHCEKRFPNWAEMLNAICRHLFFHGENLYQCSTCEYKHFRKNVVMEHAKLHPNPIQSAAIVLRESKQLWSCHVCPFRSVFYQAIMNHMQNAHNLPGQRYICSLCDDLMLTGVQSVEHYMHHHLGEKVTMLEMFNAISVPDGEKCNEMVEDKMEGMHMKNITFMKISSLKKTLPNSSINAIKVESLENNNCNTDDKNPSATQNIVECEASKINQGKAVSNSRKRKADNYNNNENDHSIVDGNTESDTTGPVKEAKQIRLAKESDCVDNSGTTFEQPLSSKEQCSDLDTSLACSTSSSSSQRRSSKRVAAKSEHSRWLESVKFNCRTCDASFGSLADLETHGNAKNISITKSCSSVGNAKRFSLLPLVRCYYCNEEDTSSALLLHCVEKHPKHSFVCVDYTDSRKCGLCSFRNESSDEVKLKSHFKLYHEISENKSNYYEYSQDSYLEWALCLGGITPSNGILAEFNHLVYICNICNEESTSAIAMGMHIAQHFLNFACPLCRKEFKVLKVLYYHVLAMHLSEELVVSPTVGDEYDEQLLDVLMMFQNGLIVSKREAQCTSVASLHELKLGLKSYRIEQLKLLEEYKTNLSLPIATIDKEISTTDTCKTFIQKQTAHPVVELKCLSNEDVASLQKKFEKV